VNQSASSDLTHFFSQCRQGVHILEWEGRELYFVKQSWGELVISRQGAQVLSFRPTGEKPLFWTSNRPKGHGAAIRGGIPLCWPWFADHPEDSSLPAHGLARTASWKMTVEDINESGANLLMTPLQTLCTSLQVCFEIVVADDTLRLNLKTKNVSDLPVTVTQALHSYLAVSSLGNVEVRGLEGCLYLDKLQSGKPGILVSAASAREETDRIFCHEGAALLVDHGWRRTVRIEKRCSLSTVLWTPGASSALLSDVGLDQVDNFLCVEAARTDAFDDVAVKPGESVCLEASFRISEYPAGII